MLSVIYDNLVYDPGLYFFGWGKIIDLYYSIAWQVIQKGTDSIASYYESVREAAENEIDRFVEAVEKIKNP